MNQFTKIALGLTITLGAGGASVGCDDTVSSKETTKTRADGSTEKKTEETKVKDDGTVTKETTEKRSETPHP